MIQKIKKGNHYCWPRRFGIAPKKYTLKFVVDESWWYPWENKDSEDVNKLGGHSIGIHQKNSVRLGYVPYFGTEIGQVRLFHYSTNNWIDSNDAYFLSRANIGDVIKMVRDYDHITYYRNGSLIGSFGHPANGISYWLNAYFGGDNTAPNNIIINSIVL